MKKKTLLLLLFTSLLIGLSFNCHGQIWSEDFSTYVEGTGIDGTGNIGDYPANVTKWTLNVSACTLADADDYIKTDYEKLKSQDLDGPAIWLSESIDLSTYSEGATFSIKFYEYSSMEADDYIDVHYQLNGGAFVLIPNWNSHGSGIHTLIDDFEKDTVVKSVGACDNLVIKVTFNNDSGYEELQMDDIFVYPNMEYVSSTTTQNTHNIAAGKTNRQIIGIEIVTTESDNPMSITSFTVNANGSSTPSSTNIENAKIYYTGTSNTFTTDTQFGSTYTTPTTSNFDITSTQQLSESTNYFWLTFDTKTGATLGELIDAECISFVIEGSTETPTITAPTGSRTLAAPLSGSYTIGAKSNYASFTAAVNDLNELGISSTVDFAVSNGTYTEQISLSAISGTSATDTIVFQSASGNREDVTLQFTPTSTNNYVIRLNGSDYISFLDMTIQSTGTSSYGRVFVLKGTTQNITLKDNNINGFDVSSDDDVYAAVYAFSGADNMASNVNIENDTITNGSYGIYFRGDNASNLEIQNTFINNVLNNFYYSGINAECQDAVIINKNTLTAKASTSTSGIIANECNNAIEMTQNRIFLNATSENCGISLYTCIGTATDQGLMANNYVSFEEATVTTEGIYLMNCGYQKIYHNSINIRTSGKNTGGNKTGNQTGVGIDYWWADPLFGYLKILNNIVKTGNVQAMSVNQTAVDNSYLENSNYNDWYTDWTTFGTWGGTSCSDFNAWKTESGQDASSVSEDPGFVTSEVPDIGNENLYETIELTPEVIIDIYNYNRNNPTTPGAVEYGDLIKDNHWTGIEGDCNWHNPRNWSLFEVPNANHNVFIGRGGSYFDPWLLLGDAECNNLTIESDGDMELNGHTINVGGDYTMIDGGELAGGHLEIGGSDNSTLTSNGGNSPEIDINKTSRAEVLLFDELVADALQIINGSLNANNNDIEIKGNADFSGGSITNTNEVKFNGDGNSELTTGSNTLQSVVVDKSGSGQLTLQDALDAATLKVDKGTMNASNNVEVSGNFTVSTTGSAADNAVVYVEAGKCVTITGSTIINDGGELRSKSSPGGGGHIIPIGNVQKNGTGKIIIEQYFTDGQWHLVSSPVADATVNSLYFNGNPEVWVKKYHESGNPSEWEYIIDLNTPMPLGKGFGYWVDDSGVDITVLFEGDILTDNLTLNSSSTPPLAFTDVGNGFNLVGNPYSCALDWDIGTWERTNLEGSVWVWQDAGAGDGSGNYLVRNLAGEGSLTDGIIPMCQGFFIRTTSSAPVLTIPTDARVDSDQQYYKASEREVAPHIVLNIGNPEIRDNVWIGFDEETTIGFDYGRDANKFFGTGNVPQLYISEQNYQLSIDILPKLLPEEEKTVVMGFVTGVSGTFTISATSLEYMLETDIILEDLKTGILQDLHDNPEYIFTGMPGDNPNRFLVHFFYVPTGIDNPVSEEKNTGVTIYAHNKAVYVKCEGETINQTGSVCIYDMYGRLLINKDLNPGSLSKISVPVSNNFIVVKVRKGNSINTKTVLFK